MDDQLKRVFAEQRQADRGTIPPFDHVWAAARAGKQRRTHRGSWAVATLGAAAVLVIGRILLRRPTIPGLDAATQLGSWQSPTASLLRFSGDDLLRAVPTIGTSHVRLEALKPTATTP